MYSELGLPALSGDVVDPDTGKKLLIVKNRATFKLSTVESAGGSKLAILATPGKSDKTDRPIELQDTKSKDVFAPPGTEYTGYIGNDRTATIKH